MPRPALAAGALLLLDVVIRLVAGEPYLGATFLLLAACGIVLLPFLPGSLARTALQVALAPLLALGSFSILLTTASLLGVGLGEVSIRLLVAGFVVVLGAATVFLPRREAVVSSVRREAVVLAALAGIVAATLAASWDVVEPFPPPGSDWAFYLLYADEVKAQGHLLIDNPYAVGEVRSLGNYPGIGAVYGSVLILDGVSSDSLVRGLAVALAVSALAVFAAVGGLWGARAGLVAAGIYAVAPVHLEPLYWHGLATTIALAFMALTLLALGLLYRGGRGWRIVLLLAFALVGVAVMHSVSAGIVGLVLAIGLVGDVVLGLALGRRHALSDWWREGVTRPVLAAVGAAVVMGAGVVAHLRIHGAEAGSPVSYRFFDRDWLDMDTLEDYFSWVFLAVVGVSLVVVLATPRLRRDSALAPFAALALSALLVSQAWRVHVPFEYRRVVYYLALALVAVVGVASLRLGQRAVVAVTAVAVVALAQVSIGLRLPQRLLEDDVPRSATVDALAAFGARLTPGDLVVADRCLGVRAPYFLRTPSLIAAEEWQVGYSEGLRDAARARAVLEGGAEGRRIADELEVRYAVVDPACTPEIADRLGGETVVDAPGLVIVEL